MKHLPSLLAACIISSALLCQTQESSKSGYTQDFVTLIEIVYGPGLLSQGGQETIDRMFEHISLDDKKVLDIGSGLGGVDCYLAQKYRVDIIGIDPEKSLVMTAQQRLNSAAPTLQGTVQLQHYTHGTSLQSFADNSFDIVFSKEVLLHVPLDEKVAYFKEMYRVLKPGGTLIILDWMHISPDYSKELQDMISMDGIAYNLVTPYEYRDNLQQAGFVNPSYTDLTEDYSYYSAQDCHKVEEKRNQIEKLFGADTYTYARISWGIQQKVFERRELLVGLYKAYKSFPTLLF